MRPFGADDPEQADTELIRACPVMGVQKNGFRDGVAELDGFEPPPQPDQVAGMYRAPRPGCLPSFDWLEAGKLSRHPAPGRLR